jgi:transcriptional regulator
VKKNPKAESAEVEMTEAEKEVAALTPASAPDGISEEEIAAKIKAGLTRDQAIAVINNQLAFDNAGKKKA